MIAPHPMSEPWLDWKPYAGGRIETNQKHVLVLMPSASVFGRIQSCSLRDGKPFTIGSVFAWDCGEKPTHWAEYPDIPSEPSPEASNG